ncbi:hypothetical protein GCM10027187_31590 [Streptosporangium sandarakinum]
MSALAAAAGSSIMTESRLMIQASPRLDGIPLGPGRAIRMGLLFGGWSLTGAVTPVRRPPGNGSRSVTDLRGDGPGAAREVTSRRSAAEARAAVVRPFRAGATGGPVRPTGADR